MYMPILMLVIFVAVQLSLIYLGNAAATAVAREATRVARVTGDVDQGRFAGYRYAANVGRGILEDVQVQPLPAPAGYVRFKVTGRAQELAPVVVPRVSQTVEGPVEEFKVDQ